VPHATRIPRVRHPRQVLRQVRTLASQQRTVTGRQARKLLQGRADRR
jgi:hypothetical protein